MRLTLYARSYCHLCEEMVQALGPLAAELGFTVDPIDVDSDPALEARYGEKVPVLVDGDGEEICHFFLDLEALRRRVAVK